MTEYVGLDVSMKETAVAVVNGEGELIKEGKVPSWPEDIERFVRRWAPSAARLGLESGSLSSWLCEELQGRGLPVICIDARHAKAALSLQVNKNDRNDARGLAQIMRTGWYREVRLKSKEHRRLAGLLASRGLLLATRRNLENQVRGLLKMAGRGRPRAVDAGQGLSAQALGPATGQEGGRQEGQGRARPQARRHPPSHVGRWYRLPVGQGGSDGLTPLRPSPDRPGWGRRAQASPHMGPTATFG